MIANRTPTELASMGIGLAQKGKKEHIEEKRL